MIMLNLADYCLMCYPFMNYNSHWINWGITNLGISWDKELGTNLGTNYDTYYGDDIHLDIGCNNLDIGFLHSINLDIIIRNKDHFCVSNLKFQKLWKL